MWRSAGRQASSDIYLPHVAVGGRRGGLSARARRPAGGLPLDLHWTAAAGASPMPQRVIRARRRAHALPAPLDGSALYFPGAAGSAPFDFTRHMRRLCADIMARCPVFHPIDLGRVLIGVTRARTGRLHGLQAKVTPMRFPGGELVRFRRGHAFQVQRYWIDGVNILYLMTFCLPRFLNQSFDEKLVTVFHELYHIAPEFNGDLRRHHGRYCVHTHSKKEYDVHMAELARAYLSQGADSALYGFLKLSFDQLCMHHPGVLGLAIPTPKLVPVDR